MSPDQPTIRIGDADREHLIDVLGRHMTAGRLDITEFESRLDAVYAARTRGDLDEVLADLPAADPPRPKPSRPLAPAPWLRPPAAAWMPWASTGAICLLIWIATSLAQGQPLYFWPMWVIGPWGLVLLTRGCDGPVAGRSARSPAGRCSR